MTSARTPGVMNKGPPRCPLLPSSSLTAPRSPCLPFYWANWAATPRRKRCVFMAIWTCSLQPWRTAGTASLSPWWSETVSAGRGAQGGAGLGGAGVGGGGGAVSVRAGRGAGRGMQGGVGHCGAGECCDPGAGWWVAQTTGHSRALLSLPHRPPFSLGPASLLPAPSGAKLLPASLLKFMVSFLTGSSSR